MVKDFDTIEIDVLSPSGLCVLCDNAVEEGLEGLIYNGGNVYLAHAMCIEEEWREKEEEYEQA